jgi:hypothetical protein
MREVLVGALFAAVVALTGDAISATGQVPKEAPKEAPKDSGKDTVAAAQTRTKLLKAKVSGEFTDVRLGDILKEFAAQVDMKVEQPVMWAYGTGFPFAQKVTVAVKEKPLDAALDQLLTKAGGGLGYVVVSKDGDKYDGWVRLTTTGERGHEPPPATAEEEATAAERLALAKKLIDAGKPASAKPVLEVIVKKYPTTKAGMEARELLSKLEK